jgi:hypothetical protein
MKILLPLFISLIVLSTRSDKNQSNVLSKKQSELKAKNFNQLTATKEKRTQLFSILNTINKIKNLEPRPSLICGETTAIEGPEPRILPGPT